MNSDHSPQAIAERVKQARKDVGLSQESLGKKLGLSKVAYRDYERVSRLFDTDQLFQLERILGRPVEWFLGLSTELQADEQQLLSLYRNLRDHHRGPEIIGLLQYLTSQLKEE